MVGEDRRDGHVRAKTDHRELYAVFDTKQDLAPMMQQCYLESLLEWYFISNKENLCRLETVSVCWSLEGGVQMVLVQYCKYFWSFHFLFFSKFWVSGPIFKWVPIVPKLVLMDGNTYFSCPDSRGGQINWKSGVGVLVFAYRIFFQWPFFTIFGVSGPIFKREPRGLKFIFKFWNNFLWQTYAQRQQNTLSPLRLFNFWF